MKETDPVGWATQSSRAEASPLRLQSRQAEEMAQQSSTEFEGAEWLEEAVRDGLL